MLTLFLESICEFPFHRSVLQSRVTESPKGRVETKMQIYHQKLWNCEISSRRRRGQFLSRYMTFKRRCYGVVLLFWRQSIYCGMEHCYGSRYTRDLL